MNQSPQDDKQGHIPSSPLALSILARGNELLGLLDPATDRIPKLPFRSRTILWTASVAAILALSFLRFVTDAEYTFASFVIIPIAFITWYEGRSSGLALTIFAIAAWVIADLLTNQHFSSKWVPYLNGATRFMSYIFIVFIVSRMHDLLIRENKRSTTDHLTGLLNARALFDAGDIYTKYSKRYGHHLSVIFIDLDNFKQINDSRGHAVGDMLLKDIGYVLRNTMRTTDWVARIGGDEFAIILAETGYAEAAKAGNKIIENIRTITASYPPVSASIGIACFEVIDRNFQDMLKCADNLMYEIKKSGKNEILIQQMERLTESDGLTVQRERSGRI